MTVLCKLANRIESNFNKRKYTLLGFVLLSFTCVMLTACGKDNTKKAEDAAKEAALAMEENGSFVYCLTNDDLQIIGIEGDILTSGDTDVAVKSCLEALQSDPSNAKYRKAISSEMQFKESTINGDQLVLNFGEGYRDMEKSKEVLARACIVKTLCQIDGIDTVSFLIEGEQLADSLDRPIGPMSSESFLENNANELSAYEKTRLTLYFSNAAGNRLVQENREVVYSGNISTEKLVVENLLAGPKNPQLQATLSSERKLNTISVKDGICYVNLLGNVVDWTGTVTEEVSLYSIVNSLTELPNINKVEISIDGDTDRNFRESLPLDTMYTRNLDLVD